jgi:hypothetical protein
MQKPLPTRDLDHFASPRLPSTATEPTFQRFNRGSWVLSRLLTSNPKCSMLQVILLVAVRFEEGTHPEGSVMSLRTPPTLAPAFPAGNRLNSNLRFQPSAISFQQMGLFRTARKRHRCGHANAAFEFQECYKPGHAMVGAAARRENKNGRPEASPTREVAHPDLVGKRSALPRSKRRDDGDAQ